MCIGGITPPPKKKKHHPILPSPPLKSANCPSPFTDNPPSVVVLHEPPPKSWIFQWTFKILKFFIPNSILSFKSNLVKIQFEFLVMTEKNIFAYKLFLSLNISDFNLFFMWKLQLPWKKSPPLSQQPPSKSWGPVKTPPFGNLVGDSTPSPCRKGGCTLW